MKPFEMDLYRCAFFGVSPPDQRDLVGPVVEGAGEEHLFPVPRPAKHGGPVHSQTFIVCLQILLPGQVLLLL